MMAGGAEQRAAGGVGENGVRERAQTIILLIVTGLLWSVGGAFIKTTDAHPFVISSIRSFTAAACLLAYVRFRPRFEFSRAQFIGALCYAATVTSFVTATKLTTSANAILLQYSSPVFVAVIGWFVLKQALYWYDYLSMGGVAIGLVFLLSGTIGLGSLAGNIIAVASGLFYASLMVSLKMHKTDSRVETIILGNLLAALIGIPFIIMNPIGASELPPILFLGIFQIALPYILFVKASIRASALELSLIPMIEPLLNPVWVYFAIREIPAAPTFIGGAVLLGVIAFRSVIIIKSPNKK
jgi:drug/metabolite transporter (DMT)-like permease